MTGMRGMPANMLREIAGHLPDPRGFRAVSKATRNAVPRRAAPALRDVVKNHAAMFLVEDVSTASMRHFIGKTLNATQTVAALREMVNLYKKGGRASFTTTSAGRELTFGFTSFNSNVWMEVDLLEPESRVAVGYSPAGGTRVSVGAQREHAPLLAMLILAMPAMPMPGEIHVTGEPGANALRVIRLGFPGVTIVTPDTWPHGYVANLDVAEPAAAAAAASRAAAEHVRANHHIMQFDRTRKTWPNMARAGKRKRLEDWPELRKK